ncbi:uncharacterized protein STEHIDRAFT_167449 [Stereum hirsutum FP-91666 SS1]|uniref:uncharacterized protein n=1 Tax=Stereum hirsutum (strain FP-91666) TaxID=721885 RepID=UPI000440F784|nr:uncharacterized protein STEHIDRAFT_167449 [Stereum hirsutum FP-91666 SS1]EIM88094.1 hypothetical protein STEHIDRAFT_167449 [Stereum hirsutum FP-91666 SS1]
MAAGIGPKYISPRSADVILSDIRPIKFNIEALGCLNVLLDEILTSIIVAAHALTTERLKLGLLKVLPTTLGKEALLEAEVELRAYWERTNASRPGSAQTAAENAPDQDFNAQWAVELMRLKCEAYSTLNDSDEDPQTEARLNARLGSPSPRKAALVAPAALYLTAVLESICEHILSNVGRVATRDSSTTTASLEDLFVALCEDDSMFSLFRTMKVYDQIETLSKMSKPRRSLSKSNSRPGPPSEHAPSPIPDVSSTASGISNRSRVSSDAPPQQSGRPSLDKSRAKKLFRTHSRTTSDRDQSQADPSSRPSFADAPRQSGQTDSFHSGMSVDGEDEESVEFDNRMRAGDTVKMSLTPDRLRTMDQEKNGRAGKRQPALKNSTERFPATDGSGLSPVAATPKTPNGVRKTSFREVDSIYEYEESKSKPHANHSLTTSPSSRSGRNASDQTFVPSPTPSRNRSLSTSHASGNNNNRSGNTILRKASMQHKPAPMPPPLQNRQPRVPPKNDDSVFGGGMPNRKRRIQRNIDDMDLDDIMNGSDEDEGQDVVRPPSAPVSMGRPPATPRSTAGGVKVSASTRELMDFLSEGPPPEMMSPPPMSMHDDLSTSQSSKQRGSGRLQRMMSKLSLGGDKANQDGGSSVGSSGRSIRRMPSTNTISAPNTPSMRSQHSFNNLGPLPMAVKPTPPRMMPPPGAIATPISPPASPSRDYDPPHHAQHGGFDSLRARSQSVSHQHRRLSPASMPGPYGSELKTKASEGDLVSMADAFRSRPPPPRADTRDLRERSTPSPRLAPSPGANGQVQSNGLPRVIARKEPPMYEPSITSNSGKADGSPTTTTATSTIAPKSSGHTHSHSRPGSRSRQGGGARPGSAGSSEKGVRLAQASSAKRAEAVAVVVPSAPANGLTREMALDMRRLMGNATNADECRLLVDMFFARAGIKVPAATTPASATANSTEQATPVGTPTSARSASAASHSPVGTETSSHGAASSTTMQSPPAPVSKDVQADTQPQVPIESSLVELFLGSGEKYPSPPSSAEDGERTNATTVNAKAADTATPTAAADTHALSTEEVDDAPRPMSPPVTPSDGPYTHGRASGSVSSGSVSGSGGNTGFQSLLEREKGAAARASIMVTPLA